MALSSVTVVANALRLRRFGRHPGASPPTRETEVPATVRAAA
jgi:hypothetical protein